MTDAALAPGRRCGSCTLCCKVMGVPSARKPQREMCGHCTLGAGCTIYAERPQECRNFVCLWLQAAQFGEHWAPARSHMILDVCHDPPRLEVHVDDDHPDAWRRAPYYDDIKGWARASIEDQGQVVVYLRDRTILILPGKDVDFGAIGATDRIRITRTSGPRGPVYDAFRVDPDDPPLAPAGRDAPAPVRPAGAPRLDGISMSYRMPRR